MGSHVPAHVSPSASGKIACLLLLSCLSVMGGLLLENVFSCCPMGYHCCPFLLAAGLCCCSARACMHCGHCHIGCLILPLQLAACGGLESLQNQNSRWQSSDGLCCMQVSFTHTDACCTIGIMIDTPHDFMYRDMTK